MNKNIDRKSFIKFISLIIFLPFIYIFGKIINQGKKETKLRKIKIETLLNGIFIENEFIISKGNNYLYVFSSDCPHLGCRISKVENNEIICPCHGSTFNYKGECIKGPALNNLKKLSYSVNTDNSLTIILS